MSDTRLMLVAMGPWMVAFVFTCWYFGYIDSNTAISGFAVSPFPTILGFFWSSSSSPRPSDHSSVRTETRYVYVDRTPLKPRFCQWCGLPPITPDVCSHCGGPP